MCNPPRQDKNVPDRLQSDPSRHLGLAVQPLLEEYGDLDPGVAVQAARYFNSIWKQSPVERISARSTFWNTVLFQALNPPVRSRIPQPRRCARRAIPSGNEAPQHAPILDAAPLDIAGADDEIEPAGSSIRRGRYVGSCDRSASISTNRSNSRWSPQERPAT